VAHVAKGGIGVVNDIENFGPIIADAKNGPIIADATYQVGVNVQLEL
jgi:hypothetical protein